MIQYASGDMFAIDVDVRVNTVNCVGIMGAGVALAFKRRYPDMFNAYQKKCRSGLIRPGKVDIWKTLTGEWVINFPTKRDWRERSRYEYIDAGLEDLRMYLDAQGEITVAMPALGCGHGGLDWSRVRPMIVEKLGGLTNASISVFEPSDSREAGETEIRRALLEQAFREVALDNVDTDDNGALSATAQGGLPFKVLLKGDPSLISTQWIGLMPSKAPDDREWRALKSVACEMSRSVRLAAVALVYATRATEEIAKLFLSRGHSVVMILPFGPLSRAAADLQLRTIRDGNYAVVSIAKAQASWNRSLHSSAHALLRSGSFRLLLTDPEPTWLKNSMSQALPERPMFYLSYGTLSDESRHALQAIRATPLGRLAATGEPNLQPLLDSATTDRRASSADGGMANGLHQLSLLDFSD